ncbi:MAG TPA: substrate-binding domain-containing protein [Mycobacteriales bacterium]|nr:substrate-binding domain-containing protein [Mycobacteriales bacterium]
MPTTLAPTRFLSVTRNRAAVVFLAVLAVMVGFALSPPAARAEANSTTLTIVGTSDVSDSGLSNVLDADFTSFYDKAHPGVHISVNYKGEGTQAAINDAEAGNGSALLVHAESLENQFVADGFSLEQYGRAVFHGDFVLLGPTSDPAQVDPTDAHNVVGAFQDIATAGASSEANFISRSDNSGTNVEEHEIWALTNVTKCTVSTANGGGSTPATTTGDCPQTAPAWYQPTNDHSQATNVEFTNTCNGLPGGTNTCYTITDRGTYDNLEAQGLIPNLKVVTQSAPGDTLLVNSFHAYAINPAAVPSTANLNPILALAFVQWLSSPAGQTASNNYLKDAPGGSPFLEDAAPVITASKLPSTKQGGKSVTVKGSVTNVVPGTPRLIGKKVTLSALRTSVAKADPDAKPVALKSVLTNRQGQYSFTFTPNANAKYTVSTAEISQIENDTTLHPPFGDLLSPASKSLGRMNVRAAVSIHKVKASKGVVTITGGLNPTATGAFAHLSLYAGHSGHSLKFVGKRDARADKHSFVLHFHLVRGFTWRLRLKYVTAGQTLTGTSAARSVTVH